jgi:hypothetical protein
VSGESFQSGESQSERESQQVTAAAAEQQQQFQGVKRSNQQGSKQSKAKQRQVALAQFD